MNPSIRLATPDDAAGIQAVYAPYCSTPISFELQPPSAQEMRLRITKVLENYPWLVWEEDSRIVGYVYACAHRERAAYRWSVDTAVYIRPENHRRGLGRAMYTELFRLLVSQGYINAYAGVTLPNPASVRLHESMGFGPVGVYRQVGFKCNAWYDVAWFQRLLQPRPTTPAPPTRLAELCERRLIS